MTSAEQKLAMEAIMEKVGLILDSGNAEQVAETSAFLFSLHVAAQKKLGYHVGFSMNDKDHAKLRTSESKEALQCAQRAVDSIHVPKV